MWIVSFLFDKLGYMPKITVDTSFPFPATQKEYEAPEFEKLIKRKATTKKPNVVAKSVRKKKA